MKKKWFALKIIMNTGIYSAFLGSACFAGENPTPDESERAERQEHGLIETHSSGSGTIDQKPSGDNVDTNRERSGHG